MKYLEILELEQLSSSLRNRIFPGGRTLTGRIEAYSTKRAGDDKKQGKLLEQRLLASGLGGITTNNTSTSNTGASGLVGGVVGGNGGTGTVHMGSGKSTVRLLIDLIQTLNASMTDFDFSCLTAESFVLVTPSELLTTVNSHLAELTIEDPSFLSHMWKNINESITLSACEVYCLADSCPFIESEDEIIWSFFYLLYNKELKRILLFACEASLLTRKNSVFDIPNDDDDDDDDELVDYEVDHRRSSGDQRYLYHIDGVGCNNDSSSMYRISSSSSSSNSSLNRGGSIGDNEGRYTRDNMLISSDILGSLQREYDITSDYDDDDEDDNDDDDANDGK